MSLDKLKTDPNHKEQFIQDYLSSSEYVDAAMAAETKESAKKALQGIKDNLVALFINMELLIANHCRISMDRK